MLKYCRDRVLLVAILILWAALLTGCASYVDQDQLSSIPALTVTLAGGHELGQSFVAQHGGLDGVEVSLHNSFDRDMVVRADLRTGPESVDTLATTSIVVPPTDAPRFYRFAFPALADSQSRYYYLLLRPEPGALVKAEAGLGTSYLNGSIYYDGEPAEGQARFRLTYDPGSAAVAVLRNCLEAVRAIAVASLAWVLPGWALLSLLLSGSTWQRLVFGEKLALSAGVGVALYPVLTLWASTLGVRLGNWLYWGPLVLALAVLAWRFRKLPQLWYGRQTAIRRPGLSAPVWPSLLFAAAILTVFVTRLLVVRTLDAPSWGDSVQHATMTQLIASQDGLFSSWEPYAPYRSLSIHFGFAANSAILMHWLDVTATQATIIAGQLLSGLAVVVLYPLALRISARNLWAGAVAVIVAGLLSPMPAFYVNWGRYAQLTGQVILPVALWLLWEAGERRPWSLGAMVAAGLALAGMMLSYYRMPFYYAVFVVPWLLFWALRRWGTKAAEWLRGLAGLAGIAAAGAAFALPWLGHVTGSTLAEGLERGMTRVLPIENVIAEYQQWRTVTEYVPLPLLIAAGLALLWAVYRRNGRVLMVGLWVALMASLVAGRLINLPGANLLQTFAVLILLYIPLGLVLGAFAGEIVMWVGRRWARAGLPAAAALLTVLLLIGAASRLSAVKPEFILVTRPDMRAMTWIAGNTPKDAVFLAEGFRTYGGSSAVGSDAGWWVPLLAGRANTMPPQYALINEKPEQPDYSRRVVSLVAALENAPPGSDRAMSELCNLGVTYVYVGQTQGKTGLGVSQLYAPEEFLADPHFTLVYHQDRVYVFAVARDACDVWAKIVM